jgi:hypothetical protein
MAVDLELEDLVHLAVDGLRSVGPVRGFTLVDPAGRPFPETTAFMGN